MGSQCQEELSAGQVSQLASRPQRLPDHVHHAQDREDGQVRPNVLIETWQEMKVLCAENSFKE